MNAVRLLSMSRVAIVCLCMPVIALSATTSESEKVPGPEVSIWVDDASLSLVVGQLAQMSGKDVSMEGGEDERVSGRFVGSMRDTLSQLTQNHPILFDLDESTLHVISSKEASSVSIALNVAELPKEYESQLLAAMVPGNRLEFREDAIRVSGHPSFVKRVTRSITGLLADVVGKQEDLVGKQENVSGKQEVEDAVAQVNTSTTDAAENIDESSAQPVADAGTKAMVADMEDEIKPASERAALSKPIRWVTDIPGFTTF